MPCMPSRESCTPSVTAAAVNEWPAPMAFTRCPASAARRTIAATSSVDRGAARSAASQRWLPAQLDSVEGIRRERTAWRSQLGLLRWRNRPSCESGPRLALVPMAASTVHGTCHHDCPDSCGWTVTVDDGVAVKLRGRVDHPYSAGELCPKVNRFLDRVYSPDRILHPLRRTGPKGSGSFERISWDDALTAIADQPAPRDRHPRRRGDPAVQRRRQPEPAGDDGPQRALLQRPRREPPAAGDLRPDGRPRHADDERQRARPRPARAAPLAG